MTTFDEFMGGGRSLSYQFMMPGDTCFGTIVKMERAQQTDMDSGQPRYFPNGQPRMMWVVTVQTDLRNGEGLKDYDPQNEEDNGERILYLRWKSEDAVRNAVRASGASAPEVGGRLALTYTKPGPKQGNFPTKEWSAKYAPPDPGSQFMAQQPALPEPVMGRPPQQAQFARVSQPAGGFSPQPSGAPQQWQRPSTLDAIQQQQRQQMPDTPPF